MGRWPWPHLIAGVSLAVLVTTALWLTESSCAFGLGGVAWFTAGVLGWPITILLSGSSASPNRVGRRR